MLPTCTTYPIVDFLSTRDNTFGILHNNKTDSFKFTRLLKSSLLKDTVSDADGLGTIFTRLYDWKRGVGVTY